MKLALCLEYPLRVRGGVSVLVETLLWELTRRGHEVILVSPDTPDTLRDSEAGKCAHGHFWWNPQQKSFSTAKHLAGRLAHAGIDLAHFHSGGNYGWANRFPYHSPIFFLGRMGVPCVSTVHLVVHLLDGYCGPRRPAWFKLLMLPVAWLGKAQQLRQVRFEIAVSQHDFQKLRRWYWPFRKRFVQIYHSRLRDGAVATPPLKREPIILNVGHITWRKGQQILVEAFLRIAARHSAWKLQLVGADESGDTVKRIAELARQHGLAERIVLLGERDDTFNLMERAGIYVQPSFWEALGLALQEAMFCGCPAVGSRAGGIPELIQEGQTGLLFEPGNVAQLSDALDELIRNKTRRESLGAAAAASIRERGMTVQAMIQRHLELYEAAIRST